MWFESFEEKLFPLLFDSESVVTVAERDRSILLSSVIKLFSLVCLVLYAKEKMVLAVYMLNLMMHTGDVVSWLDC